MDKDEAAEAAAEIIARTRPMLEEEGDEDEEQEENTEEDHSI